MPKINRSALFSLPRLVAPKELQRSFAEQAHRIDTISLDTAAAKAEALAAALSGKVFG